MEILFDYLNRCCDDIESEFNNRNDDCFIISDVELNDFGEGEDKKECLFNLKFVSEEGVVRFIEDYCDDSIPFEEAFDYLYDKYINCQGQTHPFVSYISLNESECYDRIFDQICEYLNEEIKQELENEKDKEVGR